MRDLMFYLCCSEREAAWRLESEEFAATALRRVAAKVNWLAALQSRENT